MKKYYDITIVETLRKTVRVEAEDEHQAQQKVIDGYHQECYILTSDDYSETDFETENELVVRALGENDIDALKAIDEKTGWNMSKYPMLDKSLCVPAKFVYGLFLNEKLIGHCRLTPVNEDECPVSVMSHKLCSKHSHLLSRIYIVPEQHGKGWARFMIENAIEIKVKEMQLENEAIFVMPGREDIQKICEEIGFKQISITAFMLQPKGKNNE